MKRRSKSKYLALLSCVTLTVSTLGQDFSLVAQANENTGSQSSLLSNTELIASFNFDSFETGFKGAGAVAKIVNDGVTLSDEAKLGKSAYFNGSSYLTVEKEDGSSLLTNVEAMTLSYLRKHTGSGIGWTFYAAPNNNTQQWPNEHYVGVLDHSGKILLERYDNYGSRGGSLEISGATNDWELVTVVCDTTASTIYINGEEVGNRENEYKITDIVKDNSIVQIGKANWGSGEYFCGYIDNFDIYNSALSAEQVKELYNNYLEELNSISLEELLQQDYDKLTIENVNLNDVRGNFYLETKGKNGSEITWTSSDSSVISTEEVTNNNYASTPAGVVNRAAEDKNVTLTATLKKGDWEKTKEFNLTVKAAANTEATTDYIFAYFTGNTVAGENIYFALSNDGYNFTEINDGAAVLKSELGTKGLRDPFIMRSHEGDKFYIIATDLSIGRDGDWGKAQNSGSQAIMVWESSDLVHWSEQRMITVSDSIQAGCTWAPEAYYDEITGEYVVFWASKVQSDNYSLQRVYYSKTRDFISFTEPEIWIDRQTASTIDTTVVAGNDGYLYRISKNEGNATLPDGQKVTGATVYMERAKSLFGEWEKVNAPTLEAISGIEGPTCYKLNSDDASTDTWCLLVDHYGGQGYAPVISTDFTVSASETVFTEPSDYDLPSSPRHGTVLPITASEYNAVKAAYKNTDEDPADEAVVLAAEYKFTENELGDLNDGTVIKDSTGKSSDAILRGTGAKVNDGYLYLPGGSADSKAAYVELPGSLFENQDTLTISVWLQNDTGSNDCSAMFFGKPTKYYGGGTTSYPSSYWLLNPANRSGYFKSVFTTSDSGSPWSVETPTSSTATDSDWSLYTTVITPTKVIGYLNGKKVSEGSKSYKTSEFGTGLVAAIGRSGYHDIFYKGGVYDVKVYTSKLSSEAIQKEYEEGIKVLKHEEQGNISVDTTITLNPFVSTKFNDTNKDGLGEFQGWGTSLCWWANRLGYDKTLVNEAAKVFFSKDGLNLNIGRYNVGGGDHVGYADVTELPQNDKAVIYDLSKNGTNPTHSGSNMSVSSIDFSNATYAFSDADFGFTKGAKSQSFKFIGWINGLDGSVGSGDNLYYTVEAPKAGMYTVKFLITLSGNNDRNIAIRVNNKTDYVASSSHINSHEIATQNGNHLFVATISDVELNKGTNTINIGGSGTSWTLDFAKMLIVASGDEGVVPEESNGDEFLHAPHITRSDSVVPGYCVDVTKMDLTKHNLKYYKDNFARADEISGYAWNYDWDADANQLAILFAAAKASGEDFIAEAFSNSPPYFMTVSGCSSGNKDAGTDNLREDCVNAFAYYMADVIEHINNENNGVTFQSTTPMNEPYTNYWGANSNKQEGCHFDIGESQSRIIVALNKELKNKGINIIISATDETSVDTAITAYNALTDEAKQVVTRIDTHTYSGSKKAELSELASQAGVNLWMSEVDGSFTSGTDAGEMSAALGLAKQIIADISELDSTAWILWNAVDINVDANNQYDADSLEDLGFNANGGYWGIAIGDHNNKEIILTKKYYGYGQFSRYIRPGMTIISSTGNTLAAYDSENKQAVIVAINTSDKDKYAKFNLEKFKSVGTTVTAIRTSGSVADGENWADVSSKVSINVENKNVYASLAANSITTFIISDVVFDSEYKGDDNKDDNTDPVEALTLDKMSAIPLTADMVTGSTPWNNSSNTAAKIVDSYTSTFFDGLNNGYAIIELPEVTEISAIGYCPRDGYESRMKGGMFFGSVDGNEWTMLYEIPKTPGKNDLTYVYSTDYLTKTTKYKYIKYTAADGECANIAEVKLYTPLASVTPVTYNSFTGVNGDFMYDTNGQLIQAHGGQIQQLTANGVTKWYWIGEDKTDDYRPCYGIHLYSSTDLYNWDDEGLVLKTMTSEEDFNTEYFSNLYGKLSETGELTDYQKSVYIDLWQGDNDHSTVIERPKMLYNAKTDKYVIFFHADGNSPYSTDGSNYGKAKLGIAISDNVTGPYKLLGTYLLHTNTGYNKNWDAENGHVRDMNVFQDDDGTAYVIYSSDGNQNMYIAKLNEEYTGLTYSGKDENGNPIGVEGTDYTVNLVGASREAPAMFKKNNTYYLITSGCTGWSPNPASYATAESVLGPWTPVKNPCTDDGASTTYKTQSTCVVKIAEGKYMYMGDRWITDACLLRDSRYVWLPIEFAFDGSISIGSYSDWDLSVYDSLKTVEILDTFPAEASSVKEIKELLKSSLTARYEGETTTFEIPVKWNTDEISDYAIGDVTFTGILESGKKVSFKTTVVNNQLIYFFDCAAGQVMDNSIYAGDTAFFKLLQDKLGKQLVNTVSDQRYTNETKAGYTGEFGTDIGVKHYSDNIYGYGFWAYGNKTIDYSFDLEAGHYVADLGFAEWWNTTRYMKITVSTVDEILTVKDFTLGSSDTDNQQFIEFDLSAPATVTISVAKRSGSDPVQSWIALINKDIVPKKTEEQKPTTPSNNPSSSPSNQNQPSSDQSNANQSQDSSQQTSTNASAGTSTLVAPNIDTTIVTPAPATVTPVVIGSINDSKKSEATQTESDASATETTVSSTETTNSDENKSDGTTTEETNTEGTGKEETSSQTDNTSVSISESEVPASDSLDSKASTLKTVIIAISSVAVIAAGLYISLKTLKKKDVEQ